MRTFLHYEMTLRQQSSLVAAATRFHPLCMVLFALAVFGMVCIADKPVLADSIVSPYAVTGTMTFTGNKVCGISPCTETINFAFDLGFTLNNGLYDATVIPGSMSVSSFGALGSSFGSSGGIAGISTSCGGEDNNYMGFLDSSGDEIDLHECGNLESTPVVPSFTAPQLYGCQTATCENDFVPSSLRDNSEGQLGIMLPGTLRTNVVAVPEGGTCLLYLVCSFVPIGLATLHRRERRSGISASY